MDDKLDATDLPDWSWYRGHSGAWPLPFTHIAPGGVPGGHSVDDEPEALPAAAPATSTNDSRSRVAAMIRLYDLCGCCESPPLSSSSASYSAMSFSGTLKVTLALGLARKNAEWRTRSLENELFARDQVYNDRRCVLQCRNKEVVGLWRVFRLKDSL